MIDKDGGWDNFWILWGWHSCYEEGHVVHGGSPTRENPVSICEFKYESENICWSGSSNSHFNMRELIYQKQNTFLTNSMCTI